MKKRIKTSFTFLFMLVLFFTSVGISRAHYIGTLGTEVIVNSYDFDIKKPKVYIEYERKPYKVKKIYAKVKSLDDSTYNCFWKKTIPSGTYQIRIARRTQDPILDAPRVIDTFIIMEPAIDNITPDIGHSLTWIIRLFPFVIWHGGVRFQGMGQDVHTCGGGDFGGHTDGQQRIHNRHGRFQVRMGYSGFYF